jgi:hypothetical protein
MFYCTGLWWDAIRFLNRVGLYNPFLQKNVAHKSEILSLAKKTFITLKPLASTIKTLQIHDLKIP